MELKLYMKYITLNVLGMIGLSCYILADTFFVSKGLGSNGLAALNFAIPVYNMINGTGLMIAMGGASLYSLIRHERKEKQNEIFTTSVKLVILIGVIYVAAGVLFAGNLSSMLGAKGEVYEMTKTYIRVVLIFSPAFMMNSVLISFGRNDGKPGLAMSAMLCGSIFNIIFDYIFIFPMKMGILGAVLATGFSPIVGMSIMLTHYLNHSHTEIRLVKHKTQIQNIGRICSIGTGSLVAEVSAGIVMIIFNFLMLKYEGNIGVAAYGVIANIALVVNAIFNGMAQGLQPLVSRAYGAGEKKKAENYLKYAIINIILLGSVIYIVIYLFADEITGVFNSEANEKLQMLSERGLQFYFIATVFTGFNIILSIYHSSSGNEWKGQLIAVLRGFVVIIPCAFLLAAIAGVTGIWVTVGVTEIITLVILFFTDRIVLRKEQNSLTQK